MHNTFKSKYMEWVILIISILLYVDTYIGRWSKVASTTVIGITFFPRIILSLLILSSIYQIFISPENIAIDSEHILGRKQKLILAIFPLSMIGLILILWHVSLMIGMCIFVMLWMYFLGQRSKLILLLLPLISSLIMYLLFRKAGVLLPKGI
jgi:hypothetical protein